MPISKPQAGSSPDIELPMLTSHARSFQPLPHGPVASSSSTLEKNSENHATNPTAVVDGIEPPAPAYLPNDIPPTPSFDAGLLEYTRMHGHSETPLSPRQPEDDRTSVRASEAHGEALPAYRSDIPPLYSRRPRRHDLEEPSTWLSICFKLGFVFPPFWLCGALTLISPQGPIARMCMRWFQDFDPSIAIATDSWDQTEAEKEAYLARVRLSERKWAKKCFFAFFLLACFIIAFAVIAVGVTRVR